MAKAANDGVRIELGEAAVEAQETWLLGDPPPELRTLGDVADTLDALAEWCEALAAVAIAESGAAKSPAQTLTSVVGGELLFALRELAHALRHGRRPRFAYAVGFEDLAPSLERCARAVLRDIGHNPDAGIPARLLLEAADRLRHEAA